MATKQPAFNGGRGSSLQVLLVENDSDDAVQVREMLAEARLDLPDLPAFQVRRAFNLAAALDHLQVYGVDLILLALDLPECDGLEGFYEVRSAAPAVPVILLAARRDSAAAIEALRAGCQDYLIRDEITPLAVGRTVCQAVERHRWVRRRLDEERDLHAAAVLEQELLERIGEAIVLVDLSDTVLFANPAARDLLGVDKVCTGASFTFPTDIEGPAEVEVELDGARRIIETRASRVTWEGAPGRLVVLRDITDRRHDEPSGAISQIQAIAERKGAMEALARRVSELSALNNMAMIGLEAQSEKMLFSRTIDEVFGLLDIEIGGVLTLDEDAGELVLAAHRGGEDGLAEAASRLKRGEGLAGRVAQTGEPIAIAGLSEYRGPLKPLLQERGVRSMAAVPLKANGSVIGVMSLGSRSPAFFDEARLGVLKGIASQVSVCFEKLRLDRAMREAFEFNEVILESSPLGITTFEATGRCVFANRASARIIGLAREEMLQQDFRCMTAWRESGLLQTAEEVLKGGKSRSLEVRFSSAAGKDIWIECHLSRIAIEGRVHLLLLFSDIGEPRLLEERARKLSRAVEQSPVSVIITDTSGEIEYVNPKFTEVTGYELDEVLGKNPRILKSGKIAKRTYRHLWQKIMAGGEWRGELQNKAKNGKLFWESAAISPIVDSEGRITHFLAVKEDITEQKRLEAALRDSESRFRRVVENMSEALVIDDLAGNVAFVNDRFLSLFGVDREEALHMSLESYVAPEFRKKLRDRHDRRMRGEEVPTEFEYQAVRPDGHLFWAEVRVAPIHDAKGDLIGTQSTLRDITERKQAEEARSRLVAVLDATPDFVAIGDTRGRALHLNRAARTLLGLHESDDLAGVRIVDKVAERERQTILETAIPAAGCDDVWQGETAFVDPEGREFPVSLVILAHRKKDGRIAFFSTISRDLSKQKALEEQLRMAQKMEAVGRLAGGVAHDFNNLLTAIMGYSELLLLKLDGHEHLREQVEEIAKAGARAAGLTRQLLAFSRHEKVREEVLDLNAVVGGVEQMIKRLIGEDVTLSAVLDRAAPEVLSDRGQLEQIILNLAVNGRDAMPEGGSLSIRTAITQIEDGSNTMPVIKPGSYATLEIRDTGQGMDAETRQRIFEPFFTTKPTGKGTGLGLSTVFGIVDRWTGGIAVKSAPGSGSTFTVYLPLAESAGEKDHAIEPAEALPMSHTRATILVVEDEKSTGILIQRLLERKGYEVRLAFSPHEALQLLGELSKPVDLLLTDVIMPELSGPELVNEARRTFPDLAVLFMSGYTADRLSDYAFGKRNVHLLQKPFRGRELYEEVEKALPQNARARLTERVASS